MLLSRSPLPRPPGWVRPFDLHVLGAPPAFILSQDRTLRSERRAARGAWSPSRRMSGPRSKTTPISDFTGIDSAPCPRARHSSIASLSFVVRSLGHGIRFSGCPAASVRVGRAPREEIIYAPKGGDGKGPRASPHSAHKRPSGTGADHAAGGVQEAVALPLGRGLGVDPHHWI